MTHTTESMVTQADFDRAAEETNRLCRELDITNADHIALWIEHNTIPDEPMNQCAGWLACRIVEAHEVAVEQVRKRWTETVDALTDELEVVRRHRTAAQPEREAVLEVEHLRHVVDRDRYIVAAALGGIRKEIAGREWLLEGRGPYEWDDDDYRKEFGAALDNIRDALGPLELVAWDKSDCTTDPDRVESARQAAREMLTLPRKPKVMIAADLGLPCPACNALTTPAPAVSTDEIVAVARGVLQDRVWSEARSRYMADATQQSIEHHLIVVAAEHAARAILSRIRGEGE